MDVITMINLCLLSLALVCAFLWWISKGTDNRGANLPSPPKPPKKNKDRSPWKPR